MSLATIQQAAFAQLATLIPAASVSVTIDGTTGTGLISVAQDQSAAVMLGEMGSNISLVRVSKATFPDAPDRGKTIIVDGKKVTVSNVRNDSIGAFMVLEYTEQSPIE
jgi:hypothetical protein